LKILDRYILTSFLKTFFPLFIIIMFILLLQTIWLFISELAGKDLDFSVIIKFLTFATPRLIPMVLPLTILLTSIMVFGNFAENYEFAAMKSSGISLQRAMRTLSVFILFVGFGAFIFSNTVIPSSEKRFINLRKNLVKVKPARVIAANQFNDLGDINIKVSEKYGDNDQFLKDVIIHKKAARPGNFTVIKAKDGELQGSVNSNFITLILNDGNYYEDIQQRRGSKRKRLPFAKTHFEKYILNIDLSALDNVDMDAQQYKKGYNMLNVNELKDEIDTISKQVNNNIDNLHGEINRRIGFEGLNKNMKIDSLPKVDNDSIAFIDHFNTQQKIQIYLSAVSNTEGVIRRMNTVNHQNRGKRRALNKYEMSLHDKFSLGIACVLLFFVGAPLGAIIRKGGMGLPIVLGVAMFLTYHFIGIFAKNSAEEGGIPPFVGSWLSTFIIFPLSIFLTRRATKDRGLFSLGGFIQPIRDFLGKKKEKLKIDKKEKELEIIEEGIALVNQDSNLYSELLVYDDQKLIDIAKNYRQYDYDEEYKFTALKIITERGTSIETLNARGEINNVNFDDAKKYHKAFNKYSIITILMALLVISNNIIIKVIFKDSSLPIFDIIQPVINIVCTLVYIVMFLISMNYFNKFYNTLGDKVNKQSTAFFALGIPFYVVSYFYYRKLMKEHSKLIR